MIKDSDEEVLKTIGKLKTPENRGWRFNRCESNCISIDDNVRIRCKLLMTYVELMLQQAIDTA
jgi:hypothetical protein